MNPISNLHEYANRQKKAARLIDILVRGKITYEIACRMSDGNWLAISRGAHVKPPSSETRELVLSTLKSLEEPL